MQSFIVLASSVSELAWGGQNESLTLSKKHLSPFKVKFLTLFREGLGASLVLVLNQKQIDAGLI